MMLQPNGANTNPRSGVDRLTDGERECLTRWLTHDTAKEIALRLGISHHAVEKRLKSARSKLGVSSSLEAARLLAAAEGYGRTVAQSAELTGLPGDRNDAHDPAPGPWWQRQGRSFQGVIMMSLILFAAFALIGQERTASTPKSLVEAVQRESADFDSMLESSFQALDTNGDKSIAGTELNNPFFRFLADPVGPGGENIPSSPDKALLEFDSDGDRRIQKAEFLRKIQSLGGKPKP